jgi:hypothetical protein
MMAVYEPQAETTRVLVHDHELLYLALLAVDGVKPLSRYERPIALAQAEALRELGLLVAEVQRSTAWGRSVRHTAFSREFARLGAYLGEFDHAPLRFDAQGALDEGLHLGYPACCVEHFARYGYQPNGLDAADQALLFHWACPQCAATAELLPRYRAVWEQTQTIIHGRAYVAPRAYADEVY